MNSVMHSQSFELENSPFVVVEFCHDKTVGIVHEKWITKVENNTYAYWPPFWKDNRKLKKGVLSGEVLNPTSWRLYDIKIMKSYCKSIFLAHMYISGNSSSNYAFPVSVLYEDAHQKLVRLEKGAETSANEELDKPTHRPAPIRKEEFLKQDYKIDHLTRTVWRPTWIVEMRGILNWFW